MNKHTNSTIFLVGILAVTLLVGCQKTVEVPKQFEDWNSGDGAFAIQYPANWIPKGGINKNQGSSWAKFEDGPVSIRIDASFTQSVLGDLMGGAVDTSELPDDMRPEAELHEFNLEYYKENYRDYEEVSITTKRLPIGRTRIAEFTATQGFGKLYGIRATAITRDKGVTFRAFVPESQWRDFKPVFYEMLEGLKVGARK